MKRYILWIASALVAVATVVAIAARSGKPAEDQTANFTVEFHNGELEYVINGFDTVTLSDVFANLGIESDGEISKVTFSDPSLIAVAENAGEWSLKSLAPFSTDETLSICYCDGRVDEYLVTDDPWNPFAIPTGYNWTTQKISSSNIGWSSWEGGINWHTLTIKDPNGNILAQGKSSNNKIITGGWFHVDAPDYWFEVASTSYMGDGNYIDGVHTIQYSFWNANKAESTLIAHPAGIHSASDGSYSVKIASKFVKNGHTQKRTVYIYVDGVLQVTKTNVVFPDRGDSVGPSHDIEESDVKVSYDTNKFASCTVNASEKNKDYKIYLVTKYSIAFNGNGSTSGSMSNQNFIYGTAQNLNENKFEKKYTVTYDAQGGTCATASDASIFPFTKWAENADGSGNTYNDKTSVNNLTMTPGGLINLYAQWGTQQAVTLPSATKTGYVFTGWYTAATGGTKVGDAGASYKPTGNVTLYGQWRLESFDLTINETGLTGNDGIIVTVTASGSSKPAYVVSLDPANTSVTIKAVPAGDYAIVETSWSHAYTVEPASFNVTLNKDTEVTFSHTAKANTPAHDESSVINWKN